MKVSAGRLRMHETPDSTHTQSPQGSKPSPTNEHVLHVRPDRPIDIAFSFEHQQSRVGVAASVISHVVMAVIVFIVVTYVPTVQNEVIATNDPAKGIVWIAEPGPGGGGGGGGNKMPEPPKKAELPG